MCYACVLRGDVDGLAKTHDGEAKFFVDLPSDPAIVIAVPPGGIAQNPGGDTVPGSLATTATVTVGGSQVGYINTPGDADWYQVSLTAGQTYVFTLTGTGGTALPDSILRIRDGIGFLVGENDDIGGGNFNSSILFTAASTGTYYLDARGFGNNTGQYTLAAATAAPALPVFTTAQIVDQLVTGYWASTGSSAHRWAPTNTTITYDVSGLTAARQVIARAAFQSWEEVCGLDFVEQTGGAEITVDDTSAGAFANTSWNGSNQIISATINVDPNWQSGESAPDGYTYQTFIHEIGHTLGFGHGGNYNGAATYGVDNHYYNDTWQYTVMSYMEQDNYNGQSYRYVMTPMIADIQAAIGYYGASTARSGDTTYGHNANGVSSVFNFTSYTTAPSFTIADAGGNDTLDASGYNDDQRLDLRGGTYSSVGGLIGNIAIAISAVIENATGGGGNDHLIGNSVANILRGNAGNDRFSGDAGHDTIHGDGGNDIAYGGDGNDTINGGENDDTLDGGNDIDTLNGGNGVDRLYGRAGNDIFNGDAGNDIVYGGDGNDTLNGGTEDDFLFGENGNDTVNGGSGNDRLYGDADDDILNGDAGNDIFYGGTGNDFIDGGSGDDNMRGEGGNDIFVFDSAGDAATELGGGGTADEVRTFRATTFLSSEIENLTGLAGTGQRLAGNTLANLITGAGGNDVITGDAGNDTVNAGGGNDLVYGDAGNDTLNGEAGADTVYGGTGNDTIDGGADADTYLGGGDNDDTVNGGLGNDRIDGGIGNDQLFGNDDIDFITGNTGNDQLFGGAGNDILHGNAGNDTLRGGLGRDTLYGHAGNDTFEYFTADWAGGVFETIYDFTEVAGSNVDTLRLQGVAGNYQFIDGAGFVRVIHIASGGSVYVNGMTTATIADQVVYF